MRNRTADLLLTMETLCRLSYRGRTASKLTTPRGAIPNRPPSRRTGRCRASLKPRSVALRPVWVRPVWVGASGVGEGFRPRPGRNDFVVATDTPAHTLAGTPRPHLSGWVQFRGGANRQVQFRGWCEPAGASAVVRTRRRRSVRVRTAGAQSAANAKKPRPDGRPTRVFIAWQVQDSNLRRRCRRFYRPLPLAARATCQG